MERILEIRDFVQKKKKQGFEGYTDLLEYFGKFSPEQLNFIELTLKLGVESNKRLSMFREIVTLFVAILALIVACVPEQIKSNADNLTAFLSGILMCILLAILIFVFLSTHTSKCIDINNTALEIIKKVKNHKQQTNKNVV